MLADELFEGVELCSCLIQLRDGPERALGDRRPADHVREGEDVLLDLGREAQQAHDLGHPGARDAFPAGDGGLGGDAILRFWWERMM